MTQTPEKINDFARRVLLRQVGEEGLVPEALAEAVERAFEGLRRRLGKVVGGEGFRAMLARSLVLAKREFPWLESTQMSPNGTLVGLSAVSREHEIDEMEAGGISLLAHLLTLLVTLIGEELTGRLLCDVWPDVPFFSSNVEAQEMEG